MEIRDRGPQIDFETIDSFQKSIGIKLPLEYREFLKSFNGGMPKPNTISVSGVDYMPTVLQDFFGLGLTIESSDLDWNFEYACERFKSRCQIPIAQDTFGNLFCFRVENGLAKTIVYCSFEDDSYEFYFVCDSFSQLLKMLY